VNRAPCTVVLLLALNACGNNDPFDDPGYAAACHGPPLRTVEARNQAMEDGYLINPRYDCLDKKIWEAEEQAKAAIAEMVSKAEREAREAAARPPPSLADARAGFRTAIGAPSSGTPLPKPPPALFVRSDYIGAEGRPLAAFVTPDPRDGQRHAAIVWITGGDSSTLDDFWSEGSADNDQSASAFRKAGVIMMFPTLRGGNVDNGRREFFFGEVDDIHAAANHLAKLPYVDPARVYLGGHSTGGTLALLAAETGGRFAAVFSLGPVSRVDRYPAVLFPAGLSADQQEIRLRSPIHWLNAISTPTYLIEGTQAPSNADELEALCGEVRNAKVQCVRVYDSHHYSVIDRAGKEIAPHLVAGTLNEAAAIQLRDPRGELPVSRP
jgi:hypothetical protein